MSASEEEQSKGPVIKDRRRIDPVTGQPRQPSQGGQASRGTTQPRPGKHAVSKPGSLRPEAASADRTKDDRTNTEQATSEQAKAEQVGEQASVLLAERTADLQRVQAEYANYRKRVERDRAAVREHALASVMAELLPVLDDIGRAREHGELTGGFKSVADSLEATTAKLGLTVFGEAGEAFDPNVHEALMHSYSPEVDETTCVQVLQPGYKVGERILRPARVAVAEPADPTGVRPDAGDGETAGSDPATAAAGEPAADDLSSDDRAPDADGRTPDDTD